MTTEQRPIRGSIPALITPMLEDGKVDYPTLRKLIDWHVAEGTDCIGVVGTTGESPTVNVDEHCEIIRVSVEQAAKRIPIIAGCGANSTAEAISLAKYAESIGADAQLQVVPYYNKPTQEGLFQHFKAIAEATPKLPVILYNVPGRTVADLQHDTVLRLAVERGHGHARQRLGEGRLFGAGEAVLQIPQQKHRISGFQRYRLFLPVNVQPATPLHDQVKTGARQPVRTRMPATAIAPDVKQAGLEFQAL